jgi:RNA polymerase sigma factor (sigma-70 family)
MVWFWENSSMQVIESSPKNYLFKAVKNRCLTLINRNELKQQIVNTLYADWQSQYEDPDFYVVEELTRNIEAALSRLPESYREAFEMNRFQNMTYNEIAQKLNVSSKTVDYRIQQALKLLRVELKDYLPLLMALVRIV